MPVIATPEMSHCTMAPPSSSLSITSPIAAFTRCEPARKIEPVPSTMCDSSLMIGR
jgi:hypothetical protein